MNRLVIFALSALACVICSCKGNTEEQATLPSPHLEKRGEATQLIVEGKPFLALACELKNSSSTSREYMKPIWPKLKEAGLNTVIGSVSWEQIEPQEGVYDFKPLDELIEDARAHDLKLVLIWFASWKNGITSFTPTWVKKDSERFQMALTPDGKKLPILSTLCTESRDADARAYAAVLRHIREIDAKEQTVVMMQIENEVGLHGHTRDYHPAAVSAFQSEVPASLIEYLKENKNGLLPEMKAAWESQGYRTSGSWEQVFGKGDYTDELFMAWNYASYIEAVAAAGKEEYPIPTFVNAWIVQPEDHHPGNYPSGGPQAQNHDVWRAAAPHVDILSPDIYLPDYPAISRLYARCGNPVFIPESKAGQIGAANATFTIGEMNGIGYSPFGLDAAIDNKDNEWLYKFYKVAGSMSDKILEAQADGRISGVWLKGSSPFFVKDSRDMGDYKICFELISSGMRNGGAPQLTGGSYNPDAVGYAVAIDEGDGRFTFLGSNVRITFLPSSGDSVIGLAKVTEGYYENGVWEEMRWLNGDEIQLRYDLLSAVEEGFSGQGINFGTQEPGIVKVELFNY